MGIRKLATTIPCPHCGAGVGQPCRTRTGSRASYPHGARTRPMYEAWLDGFEEGQRDILGALDDAETGSRWAAPYIASRRADLAS